MVTEVKKGILLSRWPCLAPLLFCIIAILYSHFDAAWWLYAATLLVVGLGVWKGVISSKGAVVSVGVAMLIGSLFVSQVKQRGTAELAVEKVAYRADFKFSAQVERAIGDKKSAWLVRLRSSNQDVPTGVKLVLMQPAEFQVGDVVRGAGMVTLPRVPRNPGEFDQLRWLRSIKAVGFLRADSEPIGQEGSLWLERWLGRARGQVRERLAHGLEKNSEQAQVIRAMFLGEKPAFDSEITQAYRNSGTLHVFAVSGLHVMMLASIVALVARVMNLPRWCWIPVAVVVMAGYAGITGWGAPAVRAAIMASVFLSAYLVQRRPSAINSMALSAIIALAIDGGQLFQPGFQLSYGVLAMIVALSSWWAQRFAWVSYRDPFLPRTLFTKPQELWLWFRKRVAAALTVSSAAWCGSAPLIWWHFKMVSPIAVLAGVPMVFGLFCIMLLGCASLLLGGIYQPFGTGVNQVNALAAKLSSGMAGAFASVPMGHYKKRETADIMVFDIEDGGACVYLNFGGGVLIDGGRWKDATTVANYIKQSDGKLDSFVLTHGDVGHAGGFDQLSKAFDVKQILLPERKSASAAASRVVCKLETSGVKAIVGHAGDRYSLEEGVILEVLHNGATAGDVYSVDDRGLVLMLHAKDKKVLFMADAGLTTVQRLLETKNSLKADVLILGKHRDENHFYHDLWQRVQPRVVIASEDKTQVPQTRNTVWEQAAANSGAQVILQSKSGGVGVALENLAMKSFLY